MREDEHGVKLALLSDKNGADRLDTIGSSDRWAQLNV